MMKSTILGIIIASIIASGAAIYSYQVQASIAEGDQVADMQIDINNVFAKFGKPGFFKLLADFTDREVITGHVAISNVNCKDDGSSPFALVVANAQVGAGNSKLAIVPLGSSNLVNDVSFPGKYCTYHVHIDPMLTDTDGNGTPDFPITDIALANGDDRKAWRPHQTASATIHAELSPLGDA